MNESYYQQQEAMYTGNPMFDFITYVLMAVFMFMLARKAGHEQAWLAFIPIANVVLMLNLIGKSGWNVFLLLIPIVNIVFAIMWSVEFLRAFGRSGWMFLVCLIPVVGTIYYGYLAFSNNVQYEGNLH